MTALLAWLPGITGPGQQVVLSNEPSISRVLVYSSVYSLRFYHRGQKTVMVPEEESDDP